MAQAGRQADIPPYAEVALSVYELHGTSGINVLTSSAGMGGMYHVGVEVYGMEWSYGGADTGTGVYMVHIGQSSLGNFHSRVPLGRTKKNPEQVLDIIADMRARWRGNQYNLLQCNCAHFSVAFAAKLGFTNCPEWVNSLAGVGAGLFGSDEEETHPYVEDFDWSRFDDDEVEEMAEDGDHEALLEAVWRQAQEYTLDWVEAQKSLHKYEDLVIEFRFVVPSEDNGRLRSGLQALKSDPRLRRAVLQAAAAGLGIRGQPARSDEEGPPPLPVECRRLEQMDGNRMKAQVRVTGQQYLGKLKPRPDDFIKAFKRTLCDAEAWSKTSLELIREVQVDTTPGQVPLSRRVRNFGGGGGEVLFATRSQFKPPTSVQGTLSKLHELRERLEQQETTHSALLQMSRDDRFDLPGRSPPEGSWWRGPVGSSPGQVGFGSYGGYPGPGANPWASGRF